jgi:hypothetical protein
MPRVTPTRHRALSALLALLALLAPGGCGGEQGEQGERTDQVASGDAAVGTPSGWQLDYTVEQKSDQTISASAGDASSRVESNLQDSFTCTGSALLVLDAADEESSTYSGTGTLQCTYESKGSYKSSLERGTITGAGTPDATDFGATLLIEAENKRYSLSLPIPPFSVVQTIKGESCRAQRLDQLTCSWVPYTDVDSVHVNGDAVQLDGLTLPAGAATLTGSSTAPPEALPNTTRRVSWTLAPAGPPKKRDKDLAVEINGPPCACVEGEKVPGARVTWSARASRGGGSFAAFAVEPKGTAPKVLENTGGATGARVTLEPARGSGGVTLRARYTLNGRTVSATRDVEFCVMDSIQMVDGERDFAFDDATPGVLTVMNARSRATFNGADASPELAWTFEQIGARAMTTMKPENPTGGNVTVTYTGLPEYNAAFGAKRVEVALRKGSCNCRRESAFRAFYSPTARNHPPPAPGFAPGEAPVPNWYYYYSQTPAIAGVPDVRYARRRISSDSKGEALGQFDDKDGIVYLTDRLWQSFCRRTVPRGKPIVYDNSAGNEGIDCVAETVRHEAHHRAEWAEWWPKPPGYLLPADPDGDGVPLLVESKHPGCSSIKSFSCDERPFTDVGDREISAYWVGWQWQTASLDAQDWACGPKGKQWKRGLGCAE